MLAEAERTHLLIVLTSKAASNGPEPFIMFVLTPASLGAVKKSVLMNDYVLFCTAAYELANTQSERGATEQAAY